MRALVLEEKGLVRLRDIELNESLGPDDVRIRPCAVGICGSDVHYFTHGRIGDFVVSEPMVLGHEASGVVVEVGRNVRDLSVGDRVCMEPGIPDFYSAETLGGHYNLDPSVRFWATPPVHGCLRETVVHPARLTFRLPDQLTFQEGALVEPLAIGVYSVKRSGLSAGDTALVMGAGTIGLVTALAAVAAGCSRVVVADIKKEKLALVRSMYGDEIATVDLGETTALEGLRAWGLGGVDVVFEASGSPRAFSGLCTVLNPCGRIGLIGIPPEPVLMDVSSMQVKEISTFSIFRYVNTFPGVIRQIASGRLRVAPLVTRTFDFEQSVEAFGYAGTFPASDVKIMITIP